MKLNFTSLAGALVLGAALLGACSQEVSHTESDKPGWFGGQTHKEDTVYRNPDGTISTEHKEETIKP